MPLERNEKVQLIKSYRAHDRDVGSSEIQIALLTQRVNGLSTHMQNAPKDYNSRRGLTSLVAKRRRLLNYIKKLNPEKYQSLIEKLGLRK